MGKNSLPSDCIASRFPTEVLTDAFLERKKHMFMCLIEDYQARRVAEIGVDSGSLVKRIVGAAPYKGLILTYYCVDPWKPYPEWSDRKLRERELSVAYWQEKYENVASWAIRHPNVVKIIRKTSVEAAKEVPDNELDGIYIDSVHDYPNFVNDVWAWLPKMRPGGFVCGHDYFARFKGLIEAVDMIFDRDFRLSPDRSGNWFVRIDSEETKQAYLSKIREAVGNNPEALLNAPPDHFKQKVIP